LGCVILYIVSYFVFGTLAVLLPGTFLTIAGLPVLAMAAGFPILIAGIVVAQLAAIIFRGKGAFSGTSVLIALALLSGMCAGMFILSPDRW
jgi:hypothetical protein